LENVLYFLNFLLILISYRDTLAMCHDISVTYNGLKTASRVVKNRGIGSVWFS